MSLALVREIRRVRDTVSSRPTTSVPDDPVEFARLAGIEPEAWQKAVLRSDHKAKILLCGRRTGKSTLAAVTALYRALTTPGFNTIFVAPSLDQAQIPYLMAIAMYRVDLCQPSQSVERDLNSAMAVSFGLWLPLIEASVASAPTCSVWTKQAGSRMLPTTEPCCLLSRVAQAT
jgi:hypothetical protein